MALKIKQLETKYGAVYKDAYFKLSKVHYFDSTKMLDYEGVFYIDEDIRKQDDKKYIPEESISGRFILEDKTVNMFETAYNKIKETAIETNELINSLDKLTDTNEDLKHKIHEKYLLFVDAEDC